MSGAEERANVRAAQAGKSVTRVPCPTCGVRVGTACYNQGSRYPHMARMAARNRLLEEEAAQLEDTPAPETEPDPPILHADDVEVSDSADESGAWVHLQVYVTPNGEDDPPVLATVTMSDVEACTLALQLMRGAASAELGYKMLQGVAE